MKTHENAQVHENVPVKKGRKAVFFRLIGYYMRYKAHVAAAFLLMLGSNLFALLGPCSRAKRWTPSPPTQAWTLPP